MVINSRKQQRIAAATQTLSILWKGKYVSQNGKSVDIADETERCISNSELFQVDDLERLENDFGDSMLDSYQIEVHNESTLVGAKHLADQKVFERIGVLNFASAKNPGGGFRNGSEAQEESLARSSGLYFSLKHFPEFYEAHKKEKSLLYSDRMIYSPGCPVFRGDDGTLLDEPYSVYFLTSPAPNAGAIGMFQPECLPEIEGVIKNRINKILHLFASKKCDALVLGAWGCGVFQNDPGLVAKAFLKELSSKRYPFKAIRFSILARNDKTILNTFQTVFGG